jgi:integrase
MPTGRPSLPPRLKKRGRTYYLLHGRFTKSFETDDLARAEALLADYSLGLLQTPVPAHPTIADLLDAYADARRRSLMHRVHVKALEHAKRAGMAPDEATAFADRERNLVATGFVSRFGTKTIATTDRYIFEQLKRRLGHYRVDRINTRLVEIYRDKRYQDRGNGGFPVSDGTIHRELSVLQAAIRHAEASDKGAWFPSGVVPAFKMPVRMSEPRKIWLTKQQAVALHDAAHLPHVRLFILIALTTAARGNAILSLEWRDVDFVRGIVDFGRVDHKKRRPIVTMIPQLRDALAAARAVACSPFVIEHDGRGIGDIRRGFTRAAEAAGLPWVTMHVLKHTAISWLCQSGELSIDEIADLVDTTEGTIRRHYRHLFPEVVTQATSALTLPGLGGPTRLRAPVPLNRRVDDVVSLAGRSFPGPDTYAEVIERIGDHGGKVLPFPGGYGVGAPKPGRPRREGIATDRSMRVDRTRARRKASTGRP